MTDLRARETHFAFGDNWRDFVDTLDAAAIERAQAGLGKLFAPSELAGRRFLDIGCGSGLSMLAAARLGAREVTGVDIDSASVAATHALLSRGLPGGRWRAEVASVFDLDAESLGRFDVVHSWGVLHHTGDLWAAMRAAARMTGPGGLFAFALYRKTPMCGVWRIEKRLYSQSPPWRQAAMRGVYRGALALRLLLAGSAPVHSASITGARTERGMDGVHDLHDWMGGYPYESALPEEVGAFLDQEGFDLARSFLVPQTRGVFGSGCDEYVARRLA